MTPEHEATMKPSGRRRLYEPNERRNWPGRLVRHGTRRDSPDKTCCVERIGVPV